MKASDIPAKFPIPFATGPATTTGSPYYRAIPQASQQGTTQPGAASLADGFPPKTFVPTGSGGTPPAGQDFNGLLYQISGWSRWSAAAGIAPWDSAFAASIGGYPLGALVYTGVSTVLGRVWVSIADANATNPDQSGQTAWLPLMLASDVLALISSASSVIRVTDAAGASTPDVLTGTTAASIAAYASTHIYIFTQGAAANATTAPTGNVVPPSGTVLGALGFFKQDGSNLAAGDLPANATFLATWNAGTNRLRVLGLRPSDVPRAVAPGVTPTVYARSDGNDATADGSQNTAASAFQTLQGALNTMASRLATKTLNIIMGTSTDFAPVSALPGLSATIGAAGGVTPRIIGFGCLSANGGGASLSIAGSITLYNNVTNSQGGAVATVTASGGGSITLGSGLTLSGQGQYTVGAHLSTQGGNITVATNAAITVSSGYNNFMSTVGGNIIFNAGSSVLLNNGATFPIFAFAQGSGANISAYTGSVTFTGTNTGNGFSVTNQASIQTNGSNPSTFFPQKSSPSNVSTPNGSYT